MPDDFVCLWVFQYLGSRGAQLHLHDDYPVDRGVSILGLARSPTRFENSSAITCSSFNTWAREEPNGISGF